jgi:uncharacterized membrane protein
MLAALALIERSQLNFGVLRRSVRHTLAVDITMHRLMHTPSRRVAMTVMAALFGAACAQRARVPRALPSPMTGFAAIQRSFDFRTVEVPTAKRTVASGIDDRGQIVGYYDDSAGTHGFLLRDDKFATIDFPGATFTVALGIGAHEEIVGTYRMPGEPAVNFHGFLRTRDGRFKRIDSPPHKNTIAQRILPDGTILGCRHDDDFGASMRGAVLSAHNRSETQAVASMHNGATPDLRRIVGLYNYSPGDRSAAYVIDDGTFEPLVVPGSSATSAWDVNPAGDVVGSYRDSIGVHGFILTADGFMSLNVPKATMTRVFGINANGAVVGSFDADGRTYGFVATPTRAGRL